MQVGIALALYDKSEGSLPTVPRLGNDPATGDGPLKLILNSLALPDLSELSDVTKRPPPRPDQVPGERPVPGLVCPSDRIDTGAGGVPAPISYRATTGDTPDGSNGGFAPGRTVRLNEIEAGDGLSFTAAFSERLIGTRNPSRHAPGDYLLVSRPVDDRGCPVVASSQWRGDAGASWAEASWRSTLYNHVLTPGAVPSCIAADGLTARMGASSGHAGGVNVLIFDGSVRTVSPTVAPQVWKALATTQSIPPSDIPSTIRGESGSFISQPGAGTAPPRQDRPGASLK